MPVRNKDRHRTRRIGWLRVAVLGANDGILPTSSLVLSVAAASSLHVADGRVPDQAGLGELASRVPVLLPIAFYGFGHIAGGRAQPI
jgi:hypothetical protein